MGRGVTLCSEESEDRGEGLAGSAPHAVAWVALEQSGPWGLKAFTDSHLDPQVGRVIEETATAHGVRPALVRRPGRHADAHDPGPRTLLVASTMPGASWLLEGLVASPERLFDLDWPALAAGRREDVMSSAPGLRPVDEARLLVCTNGSRDVCCALRGRPVALAAAARFPGRVWEVTHTSGHRFAPTAALLPAGTLHGRLAEDAEIGLVMAADRGETVLAGSRGRTTWPPAGQVAELAVREEVGELGLDALTVTRADDAWLVRHLDGRAWRVTVTVEDTGVIRRESCLKDAVPMPAFRARISEPTGQT